MLFHYIMRIFALSNQTPNEQLACLSSQQEENETQFPLPSGRAYLLPLAVLHTKKLLGLMRHLRQHV